MSYSKIAGISWRINQVPCLNLESRSILILRRDLDTLLLHNNSLFILSFVGMRRLDLAFLVSLLKLDPSCPIAGVKIYNFNRVLDGLAGLHF